MRCISRTGRSDFASELARAAREGVIAEVRVEQGRDERNGRRYSIRPDYSFLGLQILKECEGWSCRSCWKSTRWFFNRRPRRWITPSRRAASRDLSLEQ